MKKNITAFFALLLVVSTLIMSLTGCYGTATRTTEVNEGDVYNVQIDNPPTSTVAAAAKSLMSAVSVIAAHKKSATYSRGSGVIYSMSENREDAFIVTNFHVIYDASAGVSENIYTFLYGMENDESAIKAEYVGGSMYYDIAVLKIKGSDVLRSSSAIPASFADSNALQVLDTVIAIGNASGNGLSATVGHINVDSEQITLLGADNKTQITIRVMRTDAAVNPGNSGGGLFNTKGEVVGIVNAKSADDSVDNIGYAIPSNVAKSIVENIIYYCNGTTNTSVNKCELGITVESINLTAEYNPETGTIAKREDVRITKFTSGSPMAGKLKVGDIIRSITIGDTTYVINRRYELVDSMLVAREGAVITVTAERDGQTVSATVTVTRNMIKEYP